LRINGLKEKNDLFSRLSEIIGIVSNLLKGSRGSKLRT